jgi:predicted small lipoprotein YifL
MLGFTTMSRQSVRARALRIAVVAALITSLAGCGIKGPLRPPPKSPSAPSSSTNPATAPATTSPALPPPTAPEAK